MTASGGGVGTEVGVFRYADGSDQAARLAVDGMEIQWLKNCSSVCLFLKDCIVIG